MLTEILEHEALAIYPVRLRKINVKDTPEWHAWLIAIYEGEFKAVADYFKEYDTIEPWLMARAVRLPEALKLKSKILTLQFALNSNRPKRKKKKDGKKTQIQQTSDKENTI